MHFKRICGVWVAVALAVLVSADRTRAQDTPGISPTTRFTPLASQLLTHPQPVRASDGKYHLAYELVLTNTTGADVAVEKIEMRDAADGRVIQTLSGADLQAHVNPLGKIGPDNPGELSISSSSTSIVWLDVVADGKEGIPQTIDHRITGTIAIPSGPKPFESIVAVAGVNRTDPIILAPPVSAGTWLMSEGCCKDFTHHRHGLAPINGNLLVPQRFAIDFFLLDDEHRTWIGDPGNVQNYLSYGQPVLSAADGTVVVASDGRPDQKPPEPPPIPPIADTVGNHVIVEVQPGAYLLYAHMKPGSIAVKVGDRLKAGEQIGLIGTTGNSTTPHLHFQTLTDPTFFPTDSTPFVFDRFELVGHETERIWDDNLGLQPTGRIPVRALESPDPRQNEMPLDRDVVRFSTR